MMKTRCEVGALQADNRNHCCHCDGHDTITVRSCWLKALAKMAIKPIVLRPSRSVTPMAVLNR